MADSKVSELTSATSLGGSDVFYLVQSNTSKKITTATIFANAANVTLKDVITVGSTPQSLGAAGIVSLSTPITHLSVGGDSGTLQIPTGSNGQVKLLVMTASSGGSYTINNANLAANANVVFEQAGHSAQLLYTNSKWYVIGGTANVTY
jgi:hypothetical protein